jgi:hypothetical protein
VSGLAKAALGLVAVLVLLFVAALAGLAALVSGGSSNSSPPDASQPSGHARADIPARMLTLYQKAAPTCPGLSWSILAAIGKIETNHGRHPTMISSAGAVGPMQFMPTTFPAYAHPVPPGGANPPTPWDPVDAVYAAARLLCANGARDGRRLRRAIWHYNHSWDYVNLIEATAKTYRTTISGPAVPPVPRGSPVSAGYGRPSPLNPKTGQGRWASGRHTGIDYAVTTGTPVRAAWNGTVTTAADQGAYGRAVTIRHPDGTYTLYAHLSETLTERGQKVTPGQLIGHSGNTGNTTGPHLHFETRTGPAYGTDTDPEAWLTAHGARP